MFGFEEGPALKSSPSPTSLSPGPFKTDTSRAHPLSLIGMPGISIISLGERLNKLSMGLAFQKHLFQASVNGNGLGIGEELTLGRETS